MAVWLKKTKGSSGHLRDGTKGADLRRQILGADGIFNAHGKRPLDHILQLDQIARPVIMEQDVHGRRGDAVDPGFGRRAVRVEKMVDQQRNVLLALPKRRQLDEHGIEKIQKIHDLISEAPQSNITNTQSSEVPKYTTKLTSFSLVSEEEVRNLLRKAPVKSCELDPIPTWILRQCEESVAPIITRMINESLQSSVMPGDFKLAILAPLLKKIGLELFKSNFRPVSNLPYVSKLTERAAACQLIAHMKLNGLFEILQSAYREGHSTETALLKVQNDLLMGMDNQKLSFLIYLRTLHHLRHPFSIDNTGTYYER